jgi:predicted RecA/RadA family phage recombinase
MKYLGSTNVFEAPVQLNSAPTDVSHAVNVSWVQSAAIMDIHPDSQVHAETILHNGEKKLKLKSLAITDVEVESVSASIAAWAAANYTGTEKQEGDIVILTNTGGRPETWIHAGGTAGNETDFIEITGSDVQASEVRAFLSAGFGLNYNVGTGEFSANNGDIRSLFSGDAAISYDSANGAFSWVGSTDNVSEGSQLYFTESRARLAISAVGPVQYNAAAGEISLNASTDDIAEGTQLYFTDQRVWGAIQADPAAGNLLTFNNMSGDLLVSEGAVRGVLSAVGPVQYDNVTGQISLNASTDDISEGSQLYFTDQRARLAISAVGPVQYNAAAGEISLNASTDDIAEGTQLYFTDQRARLALSEGSGNDFLKYDNATGSLEVAKSSFRQEFTAVNLTANTWQNMVHNLGERIVHVSAYDANGEKIQLDVKLVDATTCQVKAAINQNGLDIVVSI